MKHEEDSVDQIKIGRFIAKERKRKGYTQKQLADIIGISDKTISKWECGKWLWKELLQLFQWMEYIKDVRKPLSCDNI